MSIFFLLFLAPIIVYRIVGNYIYLPVISNYILLLFLEHETSLYEQQNLQMQLDTLTIDEEAGKRLVWLGQVFPFWLYLCAM